MVDKSSLYVLLKFLVDQASQKKAEQAMEVLTQRGRVGFKHWKNAVSSLNSELQILAQEITKIDDPGLRDQWVQQLEKLQASLQGLVGVRRGPRLDEEWRKISEAIREATTDLKFYSEEQKEVAKEAQAAQQVQREGFKEAFRWGITGFALTMTGHQLMRFGRALLSPIEKFTEFAGKTDPVSREWENTMKRIELSTLRIGRQMAEVILPTLKAAAKVSEDMAAYIEKHPALAKVLSVIGTGAIGLGAIIIVAGQLLSSISAIKSFSALMFGEAGLLARIGTALGGTALGGVGAKVATGVGGVVGVLTSTVAGLATLGIGTGVGVSHALSKTEFGQQIGFQEFGKVASVMAARIGMIAGEETGKAWFETVARWFGYFDKEGENAEESVNALINAFKKFGILPEAAVDLYEDYTKREKRAAEQFADEKLALEEKYEEDRLEAVEEYGEKRAELEEEYEESRTRITEDYLRNRERSEADYALRVSRTTEDFTRREDRYKKEHLIKLQRLDEDYQRRMASLSESHHERIEDAEKSHQLRLLKLQLKHEERVWDLMAQHDALGLKREIRRYNRERMLLEESRQEQVEELRESLAKERLRIQEDYRRREEELREEFSVQRKRRLEDFELRMVEMEEQFQLQQTRRAEDYNRQLRELEEHHHERMNELQQSHREELQLLMQEKRKQLYELQEAYNLERQQRTENLRVQMLELLQIEEEGYAAMEEAARQYVANLIAEAEALQLQGTGDVLPSRQMGGYVTEGAWWLHRGEYVLDPQTTALAERITGGRITRNSLLASLAAGRKPMASNIIHAEAHQSFSFDGSITPEMIRLIKRTTQVESERGMARALRLAGV